MGKLSFKAAKELNFSKWLHSFAKCCALASFLLKGKLILMEMLKQEINSIVLNEAHFKKGSYFFYSFYAILMDKIQEKKYGK